MRPILLAVVVLVACKSSPAPKQGPDPAPDPAPKTVGKEACAAATDCAACIGAGCNWTADHCETDCLQDASCFGPGNPAQASCPTP